MQLTVLGSGTCAATLQRSMASYHLQSANHSMLIDIGGGSLRRLLEAGKSYWDVGAIFISHMHIDHIGDFAPFLWATRFSPEFERTMPLKVFGPPGLSAWYSRLAAAHGDWMHSLPFDCELAEVHDTTFNYHDLEIFTLPMQHSVGANGYRFSESNRTLAYSGDTGMCENIVELARNVDVLLIECSFPDGDEEIDTHLTPAGVGKIAAAANAHKVVLTHMYPICENVDLVGVCRQHYGGKIELAEDLQRLRI